MAETVAKTGFVSSAEICEWLSDGTLPNDLRLETDRPWARTYRLGGSERTRYLKDLPPVQADALAAMPLLSARFPHVVPQTVAVDESRGLILLDDHGGVDMQRRATVAQKRRILITYAELQAQAASQDDLLDRLPRLSAADLVPALLAFLGCEESAQSSEAICGPARADAFFDEDRCRYCRELFQARAAALAELIGRADCLPLTINHCDLRASNVATRDNGDLVIYDWDEAVAGPAGLSLHNFFSGCATPCEMLLDPPSAETSDRADSRTLLGRYMRTLAENDYASPDDINAGLPGAMCAGVIHYLLSYSRFVPPDDSYRDDVGDIIRKRLNDLLYLGDLLQLHARETTLHIVADYRERDRADHACRVLDKYVLRRPDDAEAGRMLAELLEHPDNADAAEDIYRQHLKRHPESSSIRRHFGMWLLEELDFEAAHHHLSRAVEFGAADDELAFALDRADEFHKVCQHAEQAGEIPTIRVSAEEQFAGRMDDLRQRLAVRLFHKYGTLQIDNAFPVPQVEEMHRQYLDSYERYFSNDRHADALKVGSKRYMITVDVQGAFNSPTVYANPHVLPIIRDVLGEDLILGGFVSTCSLPGSENMRIHKDHPALFPETDHPNSLPSFAVTAIVPLRPYCPDAGTTRVYKRTHNFSSRKSKRMEHQDPRLPQGSCLLMDYRLTHQGRANTSDQVRPILTMIYHRPWFRDIVNYGKQDPLRISEEDFAGLPEEHRNLFAWTRRG